MENALLYRHRRRSQMEGEAVDAVAVVFGQPFGASMHA